MSDENDNQDRPHIDTNLDESHNLGADSNMEDATPDVVSMCGLFESCLRRYGTLLLALQTGALCSTHLIISLVPSIKDEFSRLRIWGEQTYAVLPQNARRSLDEQLRNDEETKNIVIRCLRRLNNHIEKAIVQTKKYPPTTNVDTEDDECSSLSDTSDVAQEDLESAWEIRFRNAINSMFEGIRSLYRVSVLLRRCRNSRKYLSPNNPTTPSHNALRITLDYAHILGNIQQWKFLTMRSRVGGDEHAVTEKQIQLTKENEQQEIAELGYLYQRLTWANLLRRKQFDYWVARPDVSETQVGDLDAVGRVNQQKEKTISTSLSTVPRSALGINTEAGQWRAVYAKSVVGRLNTTKVPDAPKCSGNDMNFECPFCHIRLDYGLMQKKENWKEHVLSDLRPYICTFEKCPDPGRLFITRPDWMYHEQQMHRRTWICPDGCVKALPSKADMVEHLLVAHSSNIEERRVSTYADMCEREMDGAGIETCLICSEEMSLSRLYDHLATHMEEIALFVLPIDPYQDQGGYIKEITEEQSQYAEDVDLVSVRERLEEEIKKAPIRFTDVLGRESTLPWVIVKNWTSMENTVVSAFLNIACIKPYVPIGNYRLLGPYNNIILPEDWESSVLPGWEVKMQLWPVTRTSEEDIASTLAAATGQTKQKTVALTLAFDPEIAAIKQHKRAEDPAASPQLLATPTPASRRQTQSPMDNDIDENNWKSFCDCGMPLNAFTVARSETKCKICQKIDTKLRRRAAEVAKIKRWQSEDRKLVASIERSHEIIKDLDLEIYQAQVERQRKTQSTRESH